MSALATTDAATQDWHRALMLAKDARLWRQRAAAARSRGDQQTAWSYNRHARAAELRLRDLADRLERSGVVALQA